MVDSNNLNTLYTRMSDLQRELILQAADLDMLPAFGSLSQIASLEGGLGAVDAMMDLEKPAPVQVQPREKAPVAAAPKQIVDVNPVSLTGTVKWFNTAKGYGFITPDVPGPDAFVHISAVERAGMRELHEGQKIAYFLKADARTGKSSASDLMSIE